MRRFKTTAVLFVFALSLCAAPALRAEAIHPLTAVKLLLAFWLKTGIEIDPLGIETGPAIEPFGHETGIEIDPAGHKTGMEIDPWGNRSTAQPPSPPAPTEGGEESGGQ